MYALAARDIFSVIASSNEAFAGPGDLRVASSRSTAGKLFDLLNDRRSRLVCREDGQKMRERGGADGAALLAACNELLDLISYGNSGAEHGQHRALTSTPAARTPSCRWTPSD